ncbi:hypothetical protein [Methylocella silvestris]|uniref:Uncharacterized protein n=1 Tax=Methylocella silvestris TaxID=199596 RepID=A0A2J7TDW5_METSI|nr:hypothetical protein [Methylocella silvestris]PNG24933.1 hypothetical protein CR492_16425 [Methylocella silvestris]
MNNSASFMNFNDLTELGIARVQAQNALQWLARMALSYASAGHDVAPPLLWNSAARTITTPEVTAAISLQLSLPDLGLQFLHGGKPSPHLLEIDGKSSTEIEAWLLVEMLHRDFDRDKFSKQLPYSWKDLMSGDEVKYAPQALADSLYSFTQWLQAAALILVDVKRELSASFGENDAPPPILWPAAQSDLVCWPDRFDTGFLARVASDLGAGVGSIKIAFTFGDNDGSPAGFLIRPENFDPRQAELIGGFLTMSSIRRHRMSFGHIAAYLATKAKHVLDAVSKVHLSAWRVADVDEHGRPGM